MEYKTKTPTFRLRHPTGRYYVPGWFLRPSIPAPEWLLRLALAPLPVWAQRALVLEPGSCSQSIYLTLNFHKPVPSLKRDQPFEQNSRQRRCVPHHNWPLPVTPREPTARVCGWWCLMFGAWEHGVVGRCCEIGTSRHLSRRGFPVTVLQRRPMDTMSS